MKYILSMLVVCLCLPRIVSCAEYIRVATPETVVEYKGGTVEITPRTKRFKQVYKFISSYHADKNPLKTTEIVFNTKYPEVMAAIASEESGFDPDAVGADGELSAWQILEWPGGDPTDTQTAVNAAVAVFESNRTSKRIDLAVQTYNGSGPKARAYKTRVMKKVHKIHNTEVT